MKSAATAAHPRRPLPSTDLSSPAPATVPEQPQDPALVSQLQARFDALALEEGQDEEQAQHESLLEGQGGGSEEGWMGRMLDHHPTLLVLDGKLQSIPWESLPSFGRLRFVICLCDSPPQVGLVRGKQLGILSCSLNCKLASIPQPHSQSHNAAVVHANDS